MKANHFTQTLTIYDKILFHRLNLGHLRFIVLFIETPPP